MKKMIAIFLIELIFLFCLLFIVNPIIYIKGEKNEIIEVNTKYKDKGIEVKGLFKTKTKVKIKNNVNTKKIGKYEVIYSLKNKTLKRTVQVVDTKKPDLTLNGLENLNVCSLDKYIEPGYSATDNYDGDITSKVEVTQNNNKIIYKVSDSSNNIEIKNRTLIINDVEAPVITGKNEEIIYLYSEYIDDTSVVDNCDDIELIKTGEVDTNNIGEYKIHYEAIDSHNNKAEFEKIVKVIEKPLNEKIIYLTFDDGPSYSITPQLLDILKEENVKATFFVINHSEDLNYLIKREYDEGHTVAIHSYTHNYGQIYSSEEAYFNDLNLMSEKIERIIGLKPKYVRFPGGSSNTISRFNPGIMTRLATQLEQKNYKYYDWNVSSEDAGGALNSTDVYNSVINNLNDKTNIVLLHDFESNYKTLNAIRNIIIKAKELGYDFKTIDDTTKVIHHRINN